MGMSVCRLSAPLCCCPFMFMHNGMGGGGLREIRRLLMNQLNDQAYQFACLMCVDDMPLCLTAVTLCCFIHLHRWACLYAFLLSSVLISFDVHAKWGGGQPARDQRRARPYPPRPSCSHTHTRARTRPSHPRIQHSSDSALCFALFLNELEDIMQPCTPDLLRANVC